MGEENCTTMALETAGRKQTLISVLCKYLSINPDAFPKEHLEWPDLKSVCLDLVTSSRKEKILGVSSEEREEISRWLAYADSFHLDSNSSLSKLKTLDEVLVQRSVLTGKGLCPSVADIVVWTSLYNVVIGLSADDRRSVPNLMRWFDYIQNKEDFSPIFEKINVEKPISEPKILAGKLPQPCGNADATTVTFSNVNENNGTKKMDKKEDTTEKKEKEKKKVKEEKKKNEEKEPTDKKETEGSVTALDIRVGVICKAWKHPTADSLLVEEIDVGEGKVRQVVSGLAKYYGADELLNRRVLVVTNVKPGKLRDVMSAGLVLCASNQDHSTVEPLLPPEAAKIGERVTFAGHEGMPEVVLNPKKKQLEKITPHLYTDDKGVATYKGVPFMTSAGFCSSSLAKASIK
uniref:tRNA-binding domain-containing protein n=1 Tax=Araucaria cunninghamii TaxID=56994 RepID=A0A0D6QX96_ARACU